MASKPRPGRNYKILRTILLLIPTGFILGLRLHFIIVLLKYIKPQGRPPFECSGETSPDCYLGNTQFWFSLITGFFVLFEIGMTVAWGPLERPLQYGGTGYVEEANDVFVSPDRTQSYYPQMQQQQQQQQQQGFYPQQPILLQSPSHKIDQSVTPQQPYPQLYQQPQQQNPYLPQQQYQQPFVQQQHQQQRSQPSPQPSPQPSTRGYISQAEQYEMLQQQQYQQQQQQLQQQHSFVQPAPYNPSSGY
ncbi:hypothetical protein BGW39_007977 [Mortierella sp. 14UC]|nr:hypothetical protein BGW39_007977 [Mortierella sp. 14UC]